MMNLLRCLRKIQSNVEFLLNIILVLLPSNFGRAALEKDDTDTHTHTHTHSNRRAPLSTSETGETRLYHSAHLRLLLTTPLHFHTHNSHT